MSEEAVIRRGVRNVRFTMVANATLEDDRLSIEARWLISYLLSKPDNWIIRLTDIRKKSGKGRDKVRAMIKELEKVGYLVREKARTAGKFAGTAFVINDEPTLPETASENLKTPGNDSVASLPQTEIPATAEPATVEPAPVNPPPSNTEGLVKLSSDLREGACEGKEGEGPAISPDAWKRRSKKVHKDWPTFVSDSADTAETEWFLLSEAERQKAADLMPAYVSEVRKSGRTKFCAFAVYLREKRWERLSANAAATSASSKIAAAYGKVWGAKRLVELLKPPGQFNRNLTRGQEDMIAKGLATRQSFILARQAMYGWPKVNDMHNGRRVAADAALEHVAELFGKVRQGSVQWGAWKALHEAHGWPWLPDRCPEWVWMPDPPQPFESYSSPLEAVRAALTRFETEHATLITKDAAE